MFRGGGEEVECVCVGGLGGIWIVVGRFFGLAAVRVLVHV